MSGCVNDYIKSHDQFGSTVNLNFDGSDAFQTCPGGCLSLFVTMCFLSYAILQAKYMYNKEQWWLV